MADYLIGIGTIIGSVAAVVAAVATVRGNRQIRGVQGHLTSQDNALTRITGSADPVGDDAR